MDNEQWVSAEQLEARGLGSRRTIWRRANDKKGDFPAPVKFSKFITRWRLSDIQNYEAARVAEAQARRA
jgi:prophage regulatory protein